MKQTTTSSFADRLQQVVEKVGNATKLAKASGISRRTIGAYLSGNTDPTLKRLIAIAKVADVSVQWLATGEGFQEGEKSGEVDFIRPQLGQDSQDKLNFRLDYITEELRLKPDEIAIIQASSDTMEPTVVKGDMLLLDTTAKEISTEGIYALLVNNHLLIRRCYRKTDGSISLNCDNSRYPAEMIAKNDVHTLQILGMVSWQGKRL